MADIVISIASTIAEMLVVPIAKHICYPFKYKNNMEELKQQVEKLNGARETVQHNVDEAKTQGDEIEKVVEQWLNNVDDFTKGVVKPIIDDENKAGKLCSIGFISNMMVRYSLSKKAAKTAKDGVNLLGGGTFQKVSYRSLLRKTTSIYTRGYDDFDSRKRIFNDLMEALKEADVNFIGVCGMGGVGKTTLVKRIVGQVIEDKLFDVVVMAEITEIPDIRKIQGQIADELGLKFHEESLTGRAARLRDRLKKEKRVLVVLDNIWAQLDLEAVGIPLGEQEKRSVRQEEDQKGRNDEQRQCKILLTSRNLDVLRDDMNTQKEFSVEILCEEEAGNLFWKIVADPAKQSDFNLIAIEIIRYCAGLPIAIATTANALKNKILSDWKDALDQLRRSNPRHIKGMDTKVYSAIELSYNLLESEEAKSLFLLCGLVHAGGSVSSDYLLRYGTGLGLFENVTTLEEGRNRVQMLINNLKARCLLLDGFEKRFVKMHDIVHAVAVSIASTNKLMFNIQNVTNLKEMLEERLPKDATAISLPYKDISLLPERLEYSKLNLFFLFMTDISLQIPEAFFEGMKELKVLDLGNIDLLSLPSSLHGLTKLQTLCMDECLLGDIATIGDLKKLEVLSFARSDLERLPAEIQHLTQLKLLDLDSCSKLKVITPNVISSLTQLEELYMGNSFVQWEVKGQSNASLSELKQLSSLTTLELHVLDAQIIPHDLLIFDKLERYKIFIGDVWDWSGKYETSRTLKLKLNNSIYLGNWVKSLLHRTEDLYLDELKGVKNVLYQLNGEGFQQLKHLHVQNGPELQYLVNSIEWGLCNVFPKLESLFLHNLINLEQIYHGQLVTESFSKLRIIKVRKCDRLRHLFSFSMAKNLLQLQEIEVIGCKRLEEIIFVESEEQVHQNGSNRRIEFTQLCALTLQCLPRLTDFSFNAFTPNIGSQEILAEDEYGVSMSLFSQNVVLPSLQKLKLSSINIGCTWLDQLPGISSCCQALTNLTLEECNGLKFLFSYSMVKSLVVLEMLEIRNSKSIEGIINTEELRGEGKVVFPKLIKLQLKGLPNLIKFGSRISVEFSSMTQLSIEDCPKLKTFSFSSALTSGDIKQGEQVEEINWQDDIHPLFNQKVVVPTLTSLNLSSIPIPTIWHNQLQPMSSYFQSLKEIIIDGCDTLKYVFSSSMAKSLIHLETLEIFNCKIMELVIITAGERISNTLFPKLYKLHLKHLPELKIFCNFPGNSIEWPSLAQLWIENCPKMHTFESNSPPIDMPASKEDQMNSEENLHSHIQPLFDEKVRLPNLKFLRLDGMDKLRKIWHHQLTPDSFYKLNSFGVNNCHNVLNVFPSNMLGRLQKLDELWLTNCNSLDEIFELQASSCGKTQAITATQLTKLVLYYLPKLKHIWDVNSQGLLTCQNLLSIQVIGCDSLKSIFPASVSKSLLQLQELKIKECCMLEEIVVEEEQLDEAVPRFLFPQLTCLELFQLSSLESFYPGSHISEWPVLTNLQVWKCDKVETFSSEFSSFQVIHGESQHEMPMRQHLFFVDKVLLPSLENLKLSSIIIECMWLDQLPAMSSCCQTLTSLTLDECSGTLKFLFSYSMVKSLVRLEKLDIRNCKSIEKIINTEELRGKGKVVFPKLINMHLIGLSQLTQFGSGNSVEFSSMTQLSIENCPKLKNFSSALTYADINHSKQVEEMNCQDDILPLFDQKVVLPTLTSLNLSSIPIPTIWHNQLQPMSSYFQSLKEIIIDGCDTLKYVFSFSIAKSLIHLEGLEISNCKFMELVIITAGERISNTLFPKLYKLHLKHLPELTIFCNFPGNSIEWPSLAQLWIENCPKMHTFVSNSPPLDMPASKEDQMKSEENLHSHIQPLFDEKVRLPNLKSLTIYKMDSVRKILHHQHDPDSFWKLYSVSVLDCHSLLNVFPSNMLGKLQQLDILEVSNCKSMEMIFEEPKISSGMVEKNVAEEDVEAVPRLVFPQLTFLKLVDLPRLRIFHPGLYISEWPMLKTLNMWGCEKVETLTSEFRLQETHGETQHENSIQRPLFLVDKELEIKNCAILEAIIFTEEETMRNTLFPNLNELKLMDLPELMNFYYFAENAIELPSLATLWIENCPNMQTFISNFTSTDMSTSKDIQPLFDEKDAFPNLEELSLEWNCIVKEILNGKFSWYSCKIKDLRLNYASKETAICPCFLLYTLPNLEQLGVYNGVLEEMFMCEGLGCEEKYGEAPIKLNSLILSGLNDSLNLWEENSLLCKLFQILTTLEVTSCRKLQTLVSSFTSFQNLTTLEVSKCNGLLNLMAVSAAKNLVQLTRLKITECKMIEEIILHGEDLEEDLIIFNKLKYLELHCLPMLTSFYFGNYAIEFPSLQQVVVRQCPNMEYFSQGALSTPRLHKLQTEEAEQGFWEGSLNTTIKQLFKDMVGFRGIENFTVTDFPHLIEVWHKQIPFSYFSNLKSLVVDDNRFSLRYMFTPSVALGLVQLQELEIKNCAILEAIIFTEEETMRNTLFPNLNELKLIDLPELMSFYYFAENAIELPSLATLWIENCPNMQTFISNFTSTDMSTSKDIRPLFDEKVRLPNLKSLTIYKMDSVRKILHHQHDPDSFWKLYGVSVLDCHSLLNVFPSNMLGKLQQLDILEVSNCKSMEMIFEEPKISSGMVEKNVAEEDVEAVPRLVFPQLTFLKLVDLPRLRIFHPGLYISEWPMLKTLNMWGCEKVETLTSEFRLQETHGETQHENSIQRPLFLVDKDAFPNLEELSLEWNCIVKEILNGKFSWYSCKIKDLRLNYASKETAICPCFLLYTLPNLEQLGVYNGVLEEMFMCEGLGCEEKYGEAPIKLNSLILSGLNDSLNLWEENSLLCKLFQILTTLEVTSCRKLQTLVSSFTSFQNLTTLEVSKCNGLLNLMAVSAAKNLVQLTRLQITECKMIEEIILHGEDLEEDLIIFNKLKYLELHCLPMLTSFYFGNYAIEFPSLQQVVVRQCPNMEYFSQGALSTPRLHKLQTEEAEEGFWEGSLNTTIKQLFKDMNRQSSKED
ncbi:hypothetical protein ACOSQ4_030319 [Xanthoceras sorbifolium]